VSLGPVTVEFGAEPRLGPCPICVKTGAGDLAPMVWKPR
jgi:hypothetical protein